MIWQNYLLYCGLGALGRILYIFYCEYTEQGWLRPDWVHTGVEFLSAVFFGTVAMLMLPVDYDKVAIVAGFFGPALIAAAQKKWGAGKLLVNLSLREAQGLLPRQRKALDKAWASGITNEEHQLHSKISDSTSSRDLRDLVRRGLVRKVGTGKNTSYVR